MKKKIVSLVLAGAMVASMAAMTGCGNQGAPANNAGSAAGENAGAEDENTLSIYAWDPDVDIPALEVAAEVYKEKNPDFKLNIIVQPGGGDIETAITTCASAGNLETLPDMVMFQDHYIQQYVEQYPDVWLDVEGAGINWDDFSAEKIDYSTIDGIHYGVPIDNGTVICAYRTDLLEAAGHTVDELTGCTWAEFIEIGEDVYNATGKYLACMDGSGNDMIYMMGQAEGVSCFKDGKPYIVENDVVKQLTEIVCEMIDKNVLYLANNWSEYTDQVIQGDMVAGIMNGNWIIPTMEKVESNAGKWAITSMPTINGGEGYASNGGSSLYITSNCNKPELARDFLAYTFGGGEGAAKTYDEGLKAGGIISTWIPAGSSEVYNKGVDFFNGQPIYADIAKMSANVQTIEQSPYHYDVRNLCGVAIVNITQNGYSLEDALQEAENQANFIMGN